MGIHSLPFSLKNTVNQKGRNPLNFLRYAIGRIHTHALTKFKIPTSIKACISPVKINTYLFSFQKGKLLIYIFTHIGGIDATHVFLFITSENNQLPLPSKVKWSSQSHRKGRNNPFWSMRPPFCLFLVENNLLLNKNLIGYPTGSPGLTKLNRLTCKDSRLGLITCIAFPDLEELSFPKFDFYTLSSWLNWPESMSIAAHRPKWQCYPSGSLPESWPFVIHESIELAHPIWNGATLRILLDTSIGCSLTYISNVVIFFLNLSLLTRGRKKV